MKNAVSAVYTTIVSKLCVVYVLFAAALAFGQVAGAGNSLARFDRWLQVPQWSHRYVYPVLFIVLMLYLAYHLWFEKRMALIVLVSFIVLKAAFDLAGGLNSFWPLVSIAIAALFLTSWSGYVVTPDPHSIERFIIVGVLSIGLLFVYGSLGLYLGRREYHVSGDTALYIKNTWLMIVGRSNIHFVGRDLLFKWTLVIASLVAIAYLLFLLFRPHRPPAPYSWSENEMARGILESYGGDSLSYFNTRQGKSYFFHGEKCFIAYRVVGGMALISADPIGQKDLFPALLTEFRRYCSRMGWRLSGVGQSDETAELLRELGVHLFILGEESLVDITTFTLEGRDVRKLRQSVNQMEREGVSVEVMFNASIPSHTRHELQQISSEWRGDNPEAGFAMGLGRLLSASDPDCLMVVAYDADMKPMAFQYWAPIYPHKGYSLDITRTRIGAPRPLSDYLIARTAIFLKSKGYQYMSLHFLALSQYYREDSEEKSRFWGFVGNLIDRWFPVVTAYNYDKKFSPQYLKRYLIYPSYLEFWRSGFTVIAAESALKLTRERERERREKAADLREKEGMDPGAR